MQYSGNSRGTRHPAFFADSNFQEATRLMELDLHLVTKAEIPHAASFLLPNSSNTKQKLAINGNHPQLYFTGTSRGQHGNESQINGTVLMGVDGIIRWRFVSS